MQSFSKAGGSLHTTPRRRPQWDHASMCAERRLPGLVGSNRTRRQDMIGIDSAIEIGRSPDEVLGPRKAHRFRRGREPGRLRMHVQPPPARLPRPERIRDEDPGLSQASTPSPPGGGRGAGGQGRLRLPQATPTRLEPVGSGTRLTLRGSARLKGAWRLLRPLFASDLRREARNDLAALKRLVEAGTGQQARSTPSPG